jgi:flagellar protein FliJ
MHRSERLNPVLELASDAERKAAGALAIAEGRVVEAERKHAELERYALEYRAALKRKTATGIDAVQLRAFHGFIGRLGDAIFQQGAAVKRAHEERDMYRLRWMDANRRARAVGKAIEVANTQERHVQNRREQGEYDERAQRAFITTDRAGRDAEARRSSSEES